LAAGAPQQGNDRPAAPDSAPKAPQGTSDPAPSDGDGELPVSIERVQIALSRPPAIQLKGERMVFRVEVLGRKMTIEDILGPDYLKGPVPAGGMTHREFLEMVTPKDVWGYAPYNNREGMTIAATSIALKWALESAIHKFEAAKGEREREAARKEVQDALAELEKARLKAGLPPK
jgi:hypothetical protein